MFVTAALGELVDPLPALRLRLGDELILFDRAYLGRMLAAPGAA